MAHDAATCYAGFESGTVAGISCYQWKTHAFKANAPFMHAAGHIPSGFSSLLNCGARALDLRLTRGGPCTRQGIGQVCMHHSALNIKDQTFESELGTIVNWCARNPTEIVLLKLVPDDMDADSPAIQAALDAHKIRSVPQCDGHGVDPATWTLEHARDLSRLPDGGLLLATWDSCVDDNFLPSIAYNPLDPSESFRKLWRYTNDTVHRRGREGKFQEVQQIWQSKQTFEDYVAAYPLHALDPQPFKYGNLESTQDSQINRRVLERISLHLGAPALNLVKINDICLHGLEIARAIGTNVTKEQEALCVAMCGGAEPRNTCTNQSTAVIDHR